MAASVKILDVRKLPATEERRVGRLDCWVTYETDTGVKGLVKLPAESYSEEALRKAIQADLTARDSLVGKTLTL